MILGVDHLALACTDAKASVGILGLAGFELQFHESNLHNAPGKDAFVHRYESIHAIAFCRGQVGTGLELTSHGQLLEHTAVGNIEPFIGPVPADATMALDPMMDRADVLTTTLKIDGLYRIFWPSFGAHVWCSDHEPPGVLAATLGVSDLAAAEKFWCGGLGAQVVGRGKGWLHVRFSAPISSWELSVVLFGSPEAAPWMLDDAGFPCVALLSTDLETDAVRLRSFGATRSSGAYTLTVAKKDITFELFRGPGGEIVELISVGTQRRSPRS